MHYVATVLIPADAPITEDAVDKAMRPYSEENSPNGRWDWWSIGGRWTGRWADDYNPTKDPANIERCSLCDGTGMRNDNIARAHRTQNPDYTCNGCDGAGQRPKWPTLWRRVAADERPAREVVDREPSYTLVTPSGAWHSETWNGESFVKDEDWDNTYRRELSKHLDMRAVVVDYHC